MHASYFTCDICWCLHHGVALTPIGPTWAKYFAVWEKIPQVKEVFIKGTNEQKKMWILLCRTSENF